ncbi:MAG: phosphoglycerate dehydrogenase [Acidimicrobiia bacterium]
MRPKVVVAEPIAATALTLLREHCRVDVALDAEAAELRERMRDAAGLVVRSGTQVDQQLIWAAPSLQVIGRAGIGVDNIDLAAATRAGVLVVNAPEANVISAAEHTMALLLGQARRLPEADAALRSGTWDRDSLEGVELHGKVLGVIGLGAVGTSVAQRALAFGMQLMAYDPYVSPDRGRRIGVELTDDLGHLLAEADFITVHLPLTRDTEGLLGKEALAKVKPGVRVVNTSRGRIIDEEALAEAVRSGRVAGAALDVFAQEPIGASPLLDLPQVVVTPHLGASTKEAQDKAGIAVAEAVVEALRGELVPSAVNVDMGRDVPERILPFLPVAEYLGHTFAALAQGLPNELTVRAEGKLAEFPVRPLALATLKGTLASVSEGPISYVNAPLVAESRGLRVTEEASLEARDYLSVVRLSGVVAGATVSLSGTLVGKKGPVLVEILDYEIELPFSRFMLIVRNDDVPGVIGRIGTFLGDRDVNIANMVVGRSPSTGEAAMMGLNLDRSLSEEEVAAFRGLANITFAQFVDLSGHLPVQGSDSD